MLHQKIGNYYLESELGSGGFGRVYRGRHSILTEREVAVKILHSFINTLEEREQFLQEAHLLERLKHPHILHIFDVGVSEGFPYIVSAFANEGSLADLLKTSAPHPLAEDIAIEIISQVGEGLLFAHQQQVIHRDLKPENILFDHGLAFLADFGIAVTLATASVKNVTITGTPPYMAPEQFQGQVSKESDQYGLACIAYELVTGRQPFTAPDFFSMGFQHLSTPPTPPSQYNPNISPHVEHAILKAMSKQRTDRFESLQDFMSALRPVSSSSGPLPATLFAQTRPTTIYVPVEESRFRHPTDESDLLTLPSSKNEAIPRQSPVTPILFAGLPTETPPDPITPVPPSFDENAAYFKTQRSASSMYQAVHPANGQYNPTVNAFPYTDKPYVVPNTPFVAPEKQNLGRMLIAGVSFILVACLVGILLFTTILHGKSGTPSSTNALTLVASTTTLPTSNARGSAVASKGSTPRSGPSITTRTTTTGVTTVPTSSAPGTTVTPGVTATQGQTTSPATNPTQAPTTAPTQAPTATPTTAPTPTDTPVPTPTDTPVPTPTNTPVPTPTPTSPPVVGTTETVYAYLTGGNYSVQTANSYSGTVQISVSGVGQAYDVSCYSDAFYVYTDQSGNAITPFHDTTSPNWVMTINGEHTDYFVSLPAYNSSHTYTFTMTAPGGTLSFGVDDNVTGDDTGYYAVTVTQE